MGYYDLRTFLAELKKEGQYVTYPHEVTLEPGVSQVGRASGRMGDDAPAVMIDRILAQPRHHAGHGSERHCP